MSEQSLTSRNWFSARTIIFLLAATAAVAAPFIAAKARKDREEADLAHPNLRRLALAMWAYADAQKQPHFPPAALTDKDSKPLLSWRVLILPYLDEGAELYREFRLNEAWDSPHNLKLVPRMPSVLAPPPGKRAGIPPGHTVCHVFIGEGTPFARPQGPRIPLSFGLGGTMNTFLIVEAGEPTPWTKPQEIVYDPKGSLPDLTGLFEDGFRAAMGDADIRFVQKGMDEELLRSAISPAFVWEQQQKRGDVDW